jgi:hypothetical protein
MGTDFPQVLVASFRYLATSPLANISGWSNGGELTRFDCTCQVLAAVSEVMLISLMRSVSSLMYKAASIHTVGLFIAQIQLDPRLDPAHDHFQCGQTYNITRLAELQFSLCICT